MKTNLLRIYNHLLRCMKLAVISIFQIDVPSEKKMRIQNSGFSKQCLEKTELFRQTLVLDFYSSSWNCFFRPNVRDIDRETVLDHYYKRTKTSNHFKMQTNKMIHCQYWILTSPPRGSVLLNPNVMLDLKNETDPAPIVVVLSSS